MSIQTPKTPEEWARWFEHADFQRCLKERALDAIANGVLITDAGLPDNQIIYANEAFSRLTGYAAEEILGRNCRFLQGDDRAQPEIARLREAIASGQPVHLELRNYRKDGTMFWNELFIAPVRDGEGKVTHFVGVQQDVTERKRLEHALAERLEQLHELDRMKRLFISAISHELRTPLTSIKGFLEFLDDGIGGPLNDEQAGYVRQIGGGLARLERLVEDLLDAARLEGGTFRLSKQTLDFCSKLADVAGEFQPQAEQEGIEIIVECPPHRVNVHADSQRLGQVLVNLLNNAVKFSPRGSIVRVQVEETDSGLYCRVIDYGIGIEPSDVPRLFKPFVQLAEGVQKTGGTGLGLSISKAIVEAHEGRIGIEPRPDGATFWFYLPTEAAPRDGGERPPE
ncbi:Alkaline phosphatase synthesis sensor protein PhoR [compost metagenome]